jgi:amino acid adenylation domain-containing protein
LIGFFVYTLVIRTELAGDPSVHEVLQQVKERMLEAQAHQDVPFERVVELVEPERTLSHSPLFQVMLAWQQTPFQDVELPGLRMQPFSIETGTAKFDVTLFVEDQGERIAGLLEYSSDLFEETTMRRLLEHWQKILEEMVQRPQARISELDLLPQWERCLLLEQWNATEQALPVGCVHQRFEQQVERTPEAVAVVYGNQRMSYGHLNEQANRLAHQLQERGVGPEVLVSLLMYRGVELLVAILAVFKAGGAYLPLDPFYPSTRMRHVLQHSQSPLILTTREFAHILDEVLNEEFDAHLPQILYIEECLRQEQRDENLSVVVSPCHLAYVIYTSGSTGLPKGAIVEQRGMLNHLYAKIRDLCLTSQDIVAQTASQCFDISVWQYLAVLLVGGRAQILDDDEARDPVALLRQVQANHITVLEVVPSLLRSMLDSIGQHSSLHESLYPLRWLISTGEALSSELCQHWFNYYPAIPLLNAYGPTECSDDVTHYPLYQPCRDTSSSVPIGKAIMNMRLYILDRTLRPVVLGTIGELYIGGIGVGRGYLRDEARTAEAFVPDPWGLEPGERLYKTGDLVRFRLDGTLEFVGRVDQQIKLRGYRIELGEIEATLRAHPAVHEAVVLLREDQAGEPRLVAYLVWTGPEELEADSSAERLEPLRRWLKGHLPLYMQPSAYVILPSLPLTTNGKIDRNALSTPSQLSASEAKHEDPRNEQERCLQQIWQQVLDREGIGIQDNFFEVGGHSLLATQVVARIRQEWGLEVPLRLLFEHPTIASLADSISHQLEQRKGQETISNILKRIELLSEDEVRNLLGQ